MMPEEMTESEAERFVMELLDLKGSLTTRQIEEEATRRETTCPDAIVRFLNKMKFRGLIRGKLSVEHRGWIWYRD